mmetsp:Transcript_40878/g.129184  ORF Transcript_40878/g.129184 Transcript_40878/m.129184 type:complete len:203 (-) Transcript_40878:275-883(-)
MAAAARSASRAAPPRSARALLSAASTPSLPPSPCTPLPTACTPRRAMGPRWLSNSRRRRRSRRRPRSTRTSPSRNRSCPCQSDRRKRAAPFRHRRPPPSASPRASCCTLTAGRASCTARATRLPTPSTTGPTSSRLSSPHSTWCPSLGRLRAGSTSSWHPTCTRRGRPSPTISAPQSTGRGASAPAAPRCCRWSSPRRRPST